MENQKPLTIEKLNQAYIKLIKMVLTGTYCSSSPHINSFYHDPSPDQAFSILNRIFLQQTPTKKQQPVVDLQNGGKRFQLKRALTSQNDRDLSKKVQDQANQLNIQIRSNGNIHNIEKPKKQYGQPTSQQKQKQPQFQLKSDKLKRITAKITQIFSANNKKVLKYEQISKFPSSSGSDNKYPKAQLTFKKY